MILKCSVLYFEMKEKIQKIAKKIIDNAVERPRIVMEVDLICNNVALNATLLIYNSFQLIPTLLLNVGYLLISYSWFILLKANRGMVRHPHFLGIWRLYTALALSVVSLLPLLSIFDFKTELHIFSLVLFVINFSLFMIFRLLATTSYNLTVRNQTYEFKHILIYGINAHSTALMQWINNTPKLGYRVVSLIQKNKVDRKAYIQEVKAQFFNNLKTIDNLIEKKNIKTLIFPDYVTLRDNLELINFVLERKLEIFVTPPMEGFEDDGNGRFKMKQLQLEDLLGRDEIKINLEKISSYINKKVILVTGGAGSIGSELIRQIAKFEPELIIVFDNAETPLHNLQLELKEQYKTKQFVFVIGDVRNPARLEFVFSNFRPNVIFHAAAYKHVPLMEENPCEAILTNVNGTIQVSQFAIKYNADSFVMISTDKAVNPTNVMGASKRIAEIYVQSLAKKSVESKVNFVTTRFGNVLGSNGSVIPHFKKQIEHGGPVTVTHPDIIRYFMTIPEACRLVMEASSFGKTGEIYVFDMGEPVKINDLARKMIELSGFVPGKDIEIKYIGLRPGEKLYEELLNDKETTLPTEHEKITKAKVLEYNFDYVESIVSQMLTAASIVDIEKTVRHMKDLVPEFISENSPFEKLNGVKAELN